MQKLLDKIHIFYNERWPSKGFMSNPEYLLFDQTRLRFEYFPKDGKKDIYIEIGFYDAGSFGRGKEFLIDQFYVQTSYEYIIESKGIYRIWIENPEQNVFDGGYLLIHVISDNPHDKSSLAERFYNYKYVTNNGRLEKVCTLWGYREDVAMIKVSPLELIKLHQLNKFYSSSRDGYIREVLSEESIIYEILFTAEEDEVIALKTSNIYNKTPDDFGYTIGISKLGSVQFFQISDTGLVRFQSNESATFILRIRYYTHKRAYKSPIEIDYISLELYSNINDKSGNQTEFKTFEVYNTVFNRNEIDLLSNLKG